MMFIDPVRMHIAEWKTSLSPGYRFDYGEKDLCVTVEVENVNWREMVELDLVVVDDTCSRRRPPRMRDRFRATFLATTNPFYVWIPYPEGHWRRHAAWRRERRVR